MTAKTPWVLKRLFPRRIWNIPASEKQLYLTFDDGPIPQVTPWVLEQLKKYDAKATFFCIGKNIKKNPEIFRRIIAEGHTIGNHSYSHLNGWKSPVGKYCENVYKAQRIIIENSPNGTASKNAFFRPPYGRAKWRQANALRKEGFKIIMWDVLSLDYDRRISPEQCFKNVSKNARPGSIIVFHDSLKAQKNMKATLPAVLEHFSKLGYSFKGLS